MDQTTKSKEQEALAIYQSENRVSGAETNRQPLLESGTVKRHFSACEKFMRICQNWPLDKFMRFLYMRSSVLCIVTYGAIKIYAVQIYATCA